MNARLHATGTSLAPRPGPTGSTQELDAWCAHGGDPIRDAAAMARQGIALRWRAPDTEWADRISTNWWGQANQPADTPHLMALRQLRDRLLTFGGHSACLPCTDPDLQKTEARGQLWVGRGALKWRGEPGRCHSNSAILWDDHRDGWKGGRLVMATGYALSDDGMWRQHSWCICRRPRSIKVVETTLPREAYFGFVLTDDEATQFLLNAFS